MLREILEPTKNDQEISDVHLSGGSKPILRYLGELDVFAGYPRALTDEDTETIARQIMNDEQWEKFQELGELDLQYSAPGLPRFRVNVFYQRGSICLAMRRISTEIPTLESMGMPPILAEIALRPHGLILCTGPTGSGKSTTLAAMIDVINNEKKIHIVTLEDPIEYLHTDKNSIIHQREVTLDTRNFINGLRSALRQDPDVILIGEMRDLETINIALQAAETGHLVLATLHTTDAPKTVDRIIDAFPAENQRQVRIQLAACLEGIIAQTLLPHTDGQSRVAAMEILLGTPATKNIVREGRSVQLETVIQTSSQEGMISMDQYLLNLYHRGDITRETALERAKKPDSFKKRLEENGYRAPLKEDSNAFNL